LSNLDNTNINQIDTESLFQQKDIQEIILREQVKILHNNFLPSIFASFICATIVFISLLTSSSTQHAQLWYTCVIVSSIIRLGLIPLFRYFPQHTKMHLVLFIMGTSLAALLWGIAGSLLIPQEDIKAQIIIITILAGVSAGGIQTLNANLIASLLFLILTILPLCIWLTHQSGTEYIMLSIAMIVYLIFMIVSSYRNNRLFTQWQHYFYQNEYLLKDLSDKNLNLTNTNKSIERHKQEVLIINEMNQKLQLCQYSKEAFSIIRLTALKLFIGINGSLAIFNSHTRKLETVENWNWDNFHNLCKEFEKNDCWALRSDNIYIYNDKNNDVICNHFQSLPHGSYICIPLIVQNDVIGMLHFNVQTESTIDSYQQQIMTNFGDVVKLSLANIKLHEALKEQATHDSLTGLYNRRHLNEILPREIQRTIRASSKLCVAILDLDHFKNFNDSFGHEAGDAVLKHLSSLLSSSFRESDIICRLGGEEFIVILLDTNINDALPRLNKFRERVKSFQLPFNNGLLPSISVSIGVAEVPGQATNAVDLLRLADEALYTAKNEGRDKVIVASN
jgi:diguanylate cyclase (GGDEF)-like protein